MSKKITLHSPVFSPTKNCYLIPLHLVDESFYLCRIAGGKGFLRVHKFEFE